MPTPNDVMKWSLEECYGFRRQHKQRVSIHTYLRPKSRKIPVNKKRVESQIILTGEYTVDQAVRAACAALMVLEEVR